MSSYTHRSLIPIQNLNIIVQPKKKLMMSSKKYISGNALIIFKLMHDIFELKI